MVQIDYPKLYIESNEEIKTLNISESEWYMCDDLQNRCQWNKVTYDVRIMGHFFFQIFIML